MTIFAQPGMLTDQHLGLSDLVFFARFGYKWITYQTQNGGNPVKDFDFTPARDAGLSPGVWGVTYAQDDANNNPRGLSFVEQNRLLVDQANKLGAAHLIVDAEGCLKDGVDADPIASTIRGKWSKDAAWTTLGAPRDPKTKDNPTGNDFGMDVQAFLSRGFDVLPQAYVNAWSDYMPKNCMDYWLQEGFPRERIHLMIELTKEPTVEAPTGHLSGAGYLPLLQAAGVGTDFSIFLAQNVNEDGDDDLTPLSALSLPPARPSADATRLQVIALLKEMEAEWARQGMSQQKINNQRITLARFLLTTPMDGEWVAKRDAFKETFGVTP